MYDKIIGIIVELYSALMRNAPKKQNKKKKDNRSINVLRSLLFFVNLLPCKKMYNILSETCKGSEENKVEYNEKQAHAAVFGKPINEFR